MRGNALFHPGSETSEHCHKVLKHKYGVLEWDFVLKIFSDKTQVVECHCCHQSVSPACLCESG